jgi:hypothetical protein
MDDVGQMHFIRLDDGLGGFEVASDFPPRFSTCNAIFCTASAMTLCASTGAIFSS